jgi:tRNA dimethylallyltransferase
VSREAHQPPGPPGEPLLALVGSTASGKTEFALELAPRLGAEIVSLDSMLVYRGMDIGTAKPTDAQRAAVPTHLLDRVEPHESYDVQQYLVDVQLVLAELRARGRRALFVGGTGFYLQCLTRGLFQGPPPDRALRAALEQRYASEGAAALHRELAALDPAAAARIHPHDRKRLVRALEVPAQTGRTLTAWQGQWNLAPRPRRIVGLEPDPDRLARRIEGRTAQMLAAGWIDEVRRIEGGGGFGPTAAAALGYGEVRAHLRGELARHELEPAITARTRQFARTQRTWWRRFDDLTSVDPQAPQAIERALGALDGN